MLLIRERPSLRHSVEIETPGGRFYRWAHDEPDPGDVPGDARRSSTMPGGFSDSDLTLARKPSTDYYDLDRLTTIRTRSAAGEIVGEYRLEGRPSSSGDRMNVGAVMRGWQAHLEDNKAASIVYLDRDLSRWSGMSRSRRRALLEASLVAQDAAVRSDTENALPALITGMTGAWAHAAHAEGWYDAGPGNLVRTIYWDFEASANISAGDANWTWAPYLSADDIASAASGPGDQSAASTGSGSYTAAVARRYALVELAYAIAAGEDGMAYELAWRLAVLGNHGLPVQGATVDDLALLASDIVAHAVRTWAPLLQFTTGPDGTLQPTTFGVPHLAFYDPSNAAEIVRQATRFEVPDWAVWENRTFYLNARNARGRNWRASVAEIQLEETGPQVDRLWESIVVQYRDVDGTTRTVGPPGSGADTETAELKDDDPENPANQLGIVRRDLLTMGTSNAAAATKIGHEFLEQTKLLDSSGRGRVVGHIEDDRGVLHPYSHMRAGDTLELYDAHDHQRRRLVKADHNDGDRSTSFDIDAPPEGLQALLERLDVGLVRLGLG